MKFIGIIGVLLGCLAVTATAYQVNETIDKYTVSFEAPDTVNWILTGRMIVSDDPFGVLESGYSVEVLKESVYSTEIDILTFKTPIDTTTPLDDYLIASGETAKGTEQRIIDDRPGIVVQVDATNKYRAAYWLDDVDGKAKNFVYISSPWVWTEFDKVLKTIHVESAD